MTRTLMLRYEESLRPRRPESLKFLKSSCSTFEEVGTFVLAKDVEYICYVVSSMAVDPWLLPEVSTSSCYFGVDFIPPAPILPTLLTTHCSLSLLLQRLQDLHKSTSIIII